ncbi:hypothetical protein PM085_18755 [Halorubrum ezzemoulense]|uniref:Uncharacterized protein n=1 Tax=Halorubrum ezzemoulense TaxID=337243 RepID=A0ABT4Z839_HALEZ|nr:hypothetical protein [Halorubrum ezzemoulense]MDB2294254.1 hypothetical protein [Halorubrum ezzemoulense]
MKPFYKLLYAGTGIGLGITGLLSVYEYATCQPTLENLACLGPNTQLKIWAIGVFGIVLTGMLLVALEHELSNYYGDQR